MGRAKTKICRSVHVVLDGGEVEETGSRVFATKLCAVSPKYLPVASACLCHIITQT